ncbi:MAG: metal ABC transporter substrate-binding protein [Actinomycetota bacterium]
MRRLLTAWLLMALAGACTTGGRGSGRSSILAAFYPLAFTAAEVGGPSVEVVNLTSARTEPHDLELKPSQVARLHEARLVVFLGGGFQPAVEKIANDLPNRALDVLEVPAVMGELHQEKEGSRARAVDPHVWLDPLLMADIARAVGQRLAGVDPRHADDYQSRAEQLAGRLAEVDGAFAAGLQDCARREFVSSHTAFGYLARRYRLTEVGIAGLSPESEPSPQRLARVATFVRERGVTTIFFEKLASPRIAESLAEEVGVRTEVLDPLETEPHEGGYVEGMQRNLSALRTALECR